jgi:hypothetical protein
MLDDVLEKYELQVGDIEKLILDSYGPRIVLYAKPTWCKSLYLDMSPDGVELNVTFTLELCSSIPMDKIEEVVGEFIETNEVFEPIEEYDVICDSSTNEITLTFHTRLLNHQPNKGVLISIINHVIKAFRQS